MTTPVSANRARRIPRRGLVLATVSLAIFATCAEADLAGDITADLSHPASAVPQPVVSVGPPTGEAAAMGSGDNLSVKMTLPVGQSLTGILVPPGTAPIWTTALGKKVFWDLAVLEAVKHALAAGAAIDSLTFTHEDPSYSDSSDPDFIIDIEPYDSTPQAPVSMTTADVERNVRAALPEWAVSANVSVVPDAVGERVVSVVLSLPPAAFRLIDGAKILDPLVYQQQELASEGANIGRVTVELIDPASREPLYTGGADSMIGFSVEWYSPLVQALAASYRFGDAETGDEQVDEAISDAKTGLYSLVP